MSIMGHLTTLVGFKVSNNDIEEPSMQQQRRSEKTSERIVEYDTWYMF